MQALLDALEHFEDHVAFERLACDVLHRAGFSGLDPQGAGRRDGGKDAVLRHPELGRVVCHFSVRRDWEAKLYEDIETIKDRRIPCDHVVFVTSRQVTAAGKDRAKAYAQSAIGASLDIFDQGRMRIILASDMRLCEAYFPHLELPGSSLQRLSSVLESLVDKGLLQPSPDQLPAIPDVVASAGERAIVLASYGRRDEAIEKAVELSAHSISMRGVVTAQLMQLGALFLHQNDVENARKAFSMATMVDKTDYSAWHNLGVVREYNMAGRRYGIGMDAKGAIEAYRAALELAPDDRERANVLNDIAAVLTKLDDMAGATEAAQAAMALDSSNPEIRRNWAVITLDGAELRRSLLGLLPAPGDEITRMNLAQLELREGNIAAAEGWIRGLETLPDIPYLERLQIEIAIARFRWTYAREILQRCLLRDEADQWAHASLGRVALSKGDIAMAIAALTRAVTLDEDDGVSWAHLGRAHLEGGTEAGLKRAVEALLTSLRLSPNVAETFLQLGRAYDLQGMHGSARVEYRRALALDPTNKVAWFNLGVATEFRKDGSRIATETARAALAHYQEALALDPLYFPALVNAGADHIILHEVEAGLKLLQQAEQIEPDDLAVMGNLAHGHLRRGDRALAIDYIYRVMAQDKSNVFANMLLTEMARGPLSTLILPGHKHAR